MSTSSTTARSLRALAHLLSYPNAELRQVLPELDAALQQESALSQARRDALHTWLQAVQAQDALEFESDYVELFDRGRATSLHLFEHVHGDSRERGPAMIDLLKTYEQGGLYLDPERCHGELPDHLPVVLEFASTLAPAAMQDFIAEFAHILNAIHGALLKRQSQYAEVLAAVLELSGQAIAPSTKPIEPEAESLDASWAEPEAFAGCSSAGQQRPGQPQPLHFVPPTSTSAKTSIPRGAAS